PTSPPFPYTTLFRSILDHRRRRTERQRHHGERRDLRETVVESRLRDAQQRRARRQIAQLDDLLEPASPSLRFWTTTRLNAGCGHHHDAFAAAKRFAHRAVLRSARERRVGLPRRAHDEMAVEHRHVVEHNPRETVTPRLRSEER